MTENQHTQMWCPMVRHGGKSGASGSSMNRWGTNESMSLGAWNSCMGSKCAMWRWSEPEAAATNPGERQGFCGLAGLPTIN
jgi:hypothetical protein